MALLSCTLLWCCAGLKALAAPLLLRVHWVCSSSTSVFAFRYVRTYVHVYAPVAYGYETTLSANVVPFCVTSISPKITYIDEHCATRPWHTVAVAATPAAAVEWVRAVCARLGGKKRVVCVRAVCARLGGKVVVVVVEAPTY